MPSSVRITTRNSAELRCYVCRRDVSEPHSFYSGLCKECGDTNFRKRFETADLTGYNALVTGGRIKIGFETALKLLRCGAEVHVTTRFVSDAMRRFGEETDSAIWQRRLHFIPADFRSLSCVQALIDDLLAKLDKLDILINNAAQTVRRPPIFYDHLITPKADKMLSSVGQASLLHVDVPGRPPQSLLLDGSHSTIVNWKDPDFISSLSSIPLLPEDHTASRTHFPEGILDKDGQQEDRRLFNSWMMRLGDVHTVEFLEVLYINLIAPFMFCSQLKKVMKKSTNQPVSFIVNVSAMEGNFNDPEKDCRHPHTNIAKAGINMMTRTSAPDFLVDGILMNCVDPGWITDEKPYSDDKPRRTKMVIDEIDGAARICDPIFRGVNEADMSCGCLFKNYKEFPW